MPLTRQAIYVSESKAVRAVRVRDVASMRAKRGGREEAVKALARGIAASKHFTFEAVYERFVGKKLAK